MPRVRTSGNAGRASARAPRSEQSVGLASGLAAYGLWGVLPLYFALVAAAHPVELVANRVLWSLLFCAVLVTMTRQWGRLRIVAADRRALGWLALAACLIAVNWLTFTFAVLGGNALEASLGYFINPLVSTALGVVLLGERLSRMQWLAVVVALAAVLVLAVGHGSVPWVALTLAFSFGLYGFAKKKVGPGTTAVTGLTLETAVLVVPAAAVMAWFAATGTATLTSLGPAHFWLMAASGIITATPLLFFGAAASRLPLSMIGTLQYIAPVMQFVIALSVFHEPMPLERWIGFGLVWVAIVILSLDLVRRRPRTRAAARTAVEPA
ncbi:EamA family transporter RarD [Zhihengliuella salsuginis]|uniref:EamA family transporter RarD n=1 Tax=Zhihengliuella salsuginis TaxID=578222 RepID=UPI0035713482